MAFFCNDCRDFYIRRAHFTFAALKEKSSRHPTDRILAYEAWYGGSNPPGSTKMEFWQMWYMRRTENPENVVQFHETPPTW